MISSSSLRMVNIRLLKFLKNFMSAKISSTSMFSNATTYEQSTISYIKTVKAAQFI